MQIKSTLFVFLVMMVLIFGCRSGQPNGKEGSVVDASKMINVPADSETNSNDACNVPLVFPDSQVESVVRQIIYEMKTGSRLVAVSLTEPMPEYKGDIYNNDVENIKSIAIPPGQVKSLEGIQCLVSLEKITILNNNIKDIDILGRITKLNEIWIKNTDLVNIDFLINLNQLKILYLGYNNITTIDALTELANLEDLNLSYNEISDISPLKHLASLKKLSLEGNKIVDISPLSGLADLERIDLRENKIKDLSPLESNSGIDKGDELLIDDQIPPLDCSDMQISSVIKKLRERGVFVDVDCEK